MTRSAPLAAAVAAIAIGAAPPARSAELTATLDLGGQTAVDRGGAFEILLSRPVPAEEGRVAVLVGTEDRTDLMVRTPKGLKHPARTLTLPSGDREVAVFLVTPAGTWTEVARLPMKVRLPGGLDRAEIAPRLDLTLKGALAQEKEPPAAAGERTTFQDLTGQLDLRAAVARGRFEAALAVNVQGTSHRPEALRFSTLREEAPRVDLSTWGLAFGLGRVKVAAGAVSFGAQRHLISFFSSRGITLTIPIGSLVEISGGAFSTTALVGWDDPFGVGDGRHDLRAGQIALTPIPGSPTALRLEVTVVDGERKPIASFNAGQVTDTEKSRGGALRLAAQTNDQRLKLDAAYTRARFENPFDPLLGAGAGTEPGVVAAVATTRDARYLDASAELLHDVKLGATLPLSATLSFRHERVEPLFRTVVAAPQADLDQNALELAVRVGMLALGAQAARSEDNLGRLSSVLKTKTERFGTSATLPIASLFANGSTPPPFLPQITYGLQRVHSFGASIPTEGGFGPVQVPDQVVLNHLASVDFTGPGWRAGWKLSYADTDNRQTGRELADFVAVSNGVSLGLQLGTRFDLNLDGGLDRAVNDEQARVDRIRRLGAGAAWRPHPSMALAGSVSNTLGRDDRRTSRNEAKTYEVSGTWRVEAPLSTTRRVSGQLLLRWALQESKTEDATFGTNQSLRFWSLTSGVTLSLF